MSKTYEKVTFTQFVSQFQNYDADPQHAPEHEIALLKDSDAYDAVKRSCNGYLSVVEAIMLRGEDIYVVAVTDWADVYFFMGIAER